MQGYLLSGPKPVAAFEDWLHAQLHGAEEARRTPDIGSPESPLPVIQLRPGSAAIQAGPIEVLSPMSELGQPPVAWQIDGEGRRPAAWYDSHPGHLLPDDPGEPFEPAPAAIRPSGSPAGAPAPAPISASDGSKRRQWRPRQARRPTAAGPVKARRGSVPDPMA